MNWKFKRTVCIFGNVINVATVAFDKLNAVTRQFMVSLTSIVYIFFPTMEVNETRNCLVTDILLNIRKSAEWIRKRWNSRGLVKWAYFQKKWSIPLNENYSCPPDFI